MKMPKLLSLLVALLVMGCNVEDPVIPDPPYQWGANAEGTTLHFSESYMATHPDLVVPGTSIYQVLSVDSAEYNGQLGSFPALFVRFEGAVFGNKLKAAYGCDCLLIPLSGELANQFYLNLVAAQIMANFAPSAGSHFDIYLELTGRPVAELMKKMDSVMRNSPSG
jgi:hypothetical protein